MEVFYDSSLKIEELGGIMECSLYIHLNAEHPIAYRPQEIDTSEIIRKL
jgi:hypothetical protein